MLAELLLDLQLRPSEDVEVASPFVRRENLMSVSDCQRVCVVMYDYDSKYN